MSDPLLCSDCSPECINIFGDQFRAKHAHIKRDLGCETLRLARKWIAEEVRALRKFFSDRKAQFALEQEARQVYTCYAERGDFTYTEDNGIWRVHAETELGLDILAYWKEICAITAVEENREYILDRYGRGVFLMGISARCNNALEYLKNCDNALNHPRGIRARKTNLWLMQIVRAMLDNGQ